MNLAECDKVIGGGPHHWLFFEAGRGCAFCEAWVGFTPRAQSDDPLPTRFPAFGHDDPGYTYGRLVRPEDVDLDIEVMTMLLPVLAPTTSFTDATEIANALIELVRARS